MTGFNCKGYKAEQTALMLFCARSKVLDIYGTNRHLFWIAKGRSMMNNIQFAEQHPQGVQLRNHIKPFVPRHVQILKF